MKPVSLKFPSYDVVFNSILFILFLFAFTLNKQIVGIYYLLAILGIYAVKKSNFQLKDFPREIVYYFAIIFLLILVITISILMHDKSMLFKWRYAVYRDLLLLPLIFTSFYASNLNFHTLLKLLVTASLATCFWDVMILIEHPARNSGWLSDVINRGNMGMLAGLICLLASIYFKNYLWRFISIIGCFGGILLSILSSARGGWLAFFIVTLTLIFQQFKTNKSSIKYILSTAFLMLLIIALSWDYLPLGHRIEQTLNSFNQYISGERLDTAIGARLEMWRASWLAFLEKPIFGWGWNNTESYFIYFLEKGLVDKRAFFNIFGHPHSQYFLFLTELGLIGFISFMAMMLYPAQFFIRKLIRLNFLHDTNSSFLFLLPIIVYESLFIFCISDDTLSVRSHVLIMVIISTFCFSLSSKFTKEGRPTPLI